MEQEKHTQFGKRKLLLPRTVGHVCSFLEMLRLNRRLKRYEWMKTSQEASYSPDSEVADPEMYYWTDSQSPPPPPPAVTDQPQGAGAGPTRTCPDHLTTLSRHQTGRWYFSEARWPVFRDQPGNDLKQVKLVGRVGSGCKFSSIFNVTKLFDHVSYVLCRYRGSYSIA